MTEKPEIRQLFDNIKLQISFGSYNYMIKHSKKVMNMLKKLSEVYLILFFCIYTPLCVSATTDNTLVHKQLLKDVIEYVEVQINPEQQDNIKITALPIDARVKLYTCNSDINFELANKRQFNRQFPVKVSCDNAEKPWKTYVQVVVSELMETLVVTQSIAKGTTIDPSMIQMKTVDKHKIKSRSIADPSAVIGGRALRNLPRGYQIGIKDVCLVCKGDDVTIVAKSNTMMIKTSGTAMQSGSKGETIKVQNSSSKRIIKGVIGDLREVYVNL